MKTLVAQFLYHISSDNLQQLYKLLEENCLFINHDKTLLGKNKVITYLEQKLKEYKINHISILNSVKESKNTLLISYHMILDKETSPIYGGAVIRFNSNKISYIKNNIVK